MPSGSARDGANQGHGLSVLDDSEIHALHEALDDEHRAWATYDKVIADFGDV